MALHTVLYRSATVAAANFAALSLLPAPGDNVVNNGYLPPFDMDIMGAAAFSATMTQARIQTSLLMATASVHLVPFTAAAALPTNFNWADFTRKPVPLRMNENINVQTSASGAGETQNVILLLGDKRYNQPPPGRRLRIRLTSSTATGAGVWTTLALTPDEALPASRFVCMGFEGVAATGILSRLFFPGNTVNGVVMVPGFPSLAANTSRLPYPMLNWGFGELGTFTNTTLPQLQQFSTAADASQQVFMDIVQLDAF